MFKHYRLRSVMLGLGVMLVVSQPTAHTGASGIVKERMDAMGVLGDHARVVGDMLKGKTAFDADAVETAAAAFVMHGEQITGLFPDTEESRSGARTEALPAIWSEWDDFVAIATRFTEDSRVFANIASKLDSGEQSDEENSRAVRTAFFRTSKGCSGCHERFRLKQD